MSFEPPPPRDSVPTLDHEALDHEAPDHEAPATPATDPVAPDAEAEASQPPVSEDTEPASMASSDTELGVLQAAIEVRMDRLEGMFENKLAYDAHKEQQIDRLHQELQRHQQGLLAKATRPLLASLVRLHDNLGRGAAEIASKPRDELTPERLGQLLSEFQDDVEIVLEEHGVTLFHEPVERFEPRRQTARQTRATSEAEKVGQIVRRVRPGFEQDGKLLMKERVEVYALSATAPAD